MRVTILATMLMLTSAAAAAGPLETAREHLQSGQLDQAMAMVEPLADDDAEAAFLLGHVLRAKREWEDAGDAYEQAIELGGEIARYYNALGDARVIQAQEASLFSRLGIAKDALAAFRRAVELDPGTPEFRYSLIQYLISAPGIAGGDDDEATEHVAILERQDPIWGARARAAMLAEDGRADEVPGVYAVALETHPDSLDLRFQYGLVLVQAERFQEARTQFERILAGGDQHTGSLYQLGKLAAIAAQDPDRGIAALDTFLSLPPVEGDPPHAWALYRRGMIREQHGDLDGALADYRRALALDPEHEEADKAIARLR